MFRQEPDFHFDISGYSDKRVRDNESQLYFKVSDQFFIECFPHLSSSATEKGDKPD